MFGRLKVWHAGATIDLKRIRICFLTGGFGTAYLVAFSLLEHSQTEFYFFWTELLEPFTIYMGQGLPGIARTIDQITSLGYYARIPYVEHIFTFSLLYSIVCMFILAMNFIGFVKYLSEENRNSLCLGGIVLGYIYSMFSFLAVYHFYSSGYAIVDSLRGGFQIHLSNYVGITYGFTFILLAQSGFLFFVITTGKLVLMIKERFGDELN